MRASLVLPAVSAAVIVSVAGVVWAAAAGDPHSALAKVPLGDSVSMSAPATTAPSTPTATPQTSKAKPAPKKPAAKSPSATAAAVVQHPAPVVVSTTHRVVANASGPGPSGYALQVFNEINSERAANHVPAIHWSPQLARAADDHNALMDEHSDLEHQFPGEADFATREQDAGFHGTQYSENIAQGWVGSQTPDSLNEYMYDEPHPGTAYAGVGHRTHILSTLYTYIGVSVIVDNATGEIWITEDFGG